MRRAFTVEFARGISRWANQASKSMTNGISVHGVRAVREVIQTKRGPRRKPQADIYLELLGQVAQLVEQRTENPCVGGSIPPLSTVLQTV